MIAQFERKKPHDHVRKWKWNLLDDITDISVTINVYMHIGFDDAEEELKRMEEFWKAQAEVEQKKEKTMSQKMFKVV